MVGMTDPATQNKDMFAAKQFVQVKKWNLFRIKLLTDSEPDLDVATIVFYAMISIPVSMTLFGLIYLCRTNCNLKERFCRSSIANNLEKKDENLDYGTYYYYADGTQRIDLMEIT